METTLQETLMDIVIFINNYVIPIIIAISVLLFLWNLFRYAMLEGTTTDGREKARRLMFWGIGGIVVMTSLWGIIQILLLTFNFNLDPTVPDYLKERCASFSSNAEVEDCIKMGGFDDEPNIDRYIDGALPNVPGNIDPFPNIDPFEGTTPGGPSIQPG